MRVPVWKQKFHWLLEWPAVQMSQPGRSECLAGLLSHRTRPWRLAENSLLSASWVVEHLSLGFLLGCRRCSGMAAARFTEFLYRNLNVCVPIKICPLQSWCCWSWWQCLLDYVCLTFFCKYSVSTGAGVMVCSVWEVTDLVRHSQCFSGTSAV